jgi:hypothetical protein
MAKIRDSSNSKRAKPRRRQEFDNSSTQLEKRLDIRNLKNSLIIKKDPKSISYKEITSRITSHHKNLLKVKSHYTPEFDIVKGNLKRKELYNIPKWFSSLRNSLQLYLDVHILEKLELNDNYVVNSYHILGEEDQVIVTSYYIDYIFKLVSLAIENGREEHMAKARQVRRKRRKGADIEKLADSRTFSSELKNIILKDINHCIAELLEDHAGITDIEKRTILLRRKFISNKLKSKYGESWRAKLSR